MMREFVKSFAVLSCILNLASGDAFATQDVVKGIGQSSKVTRTAKTVGGIFATGAVGSMAAGGIMAANAAAGTAVAATSASIGSIPLLTAAAVGGTAALTAISGGIALGAIAVAGGVGYGGYKVYQKYRSRLMGISSETLQQISLQAKKARLSPTVLVSKYLKAKLDQVCVANGFPDGVDMKTVKKQTRETNTFNSLRRSNELTAYDEDGNLQKYPYIKGFKHILITQMECKNPVEADYALVQSIDDPILKNLIGEQLAARKGVPVAAVSSRTRSLKSGSGFTGSSSRRTSVSTSLSGT